jgi:hypothetical protein
LPSWLSWRGCGGVPRAAAPPRGGFRGSPQAARPSLGQESRDFLRMSRIRTCIAPPGGRPTYQSGPCRPTFMGSSTGSGVLMRIWAGADDVLRSGCGALLRRACQRLARLGRAVRAVRAVRVARGAAEYLDGGAPPCQRRYSPHASSTTRKVSPSQGLQCAIVTRRPCSRRVSCRLLPSPGARGPGPAATHQGADGRLQRAALGGTPTARRARYNHRGRHRRHRHRLIGPR